VNISKTKIDDLNAVIKVNLTAEDYRDEVKATIKEYARKANWKGFRKGKVPESIIRKTMGKGVLLEELNRQISTNIGEYLREEKLDILGDPLMKEVDDLDLDPEAGKSFEFEYEIGLSPKFQLKFETAKPPVQYEVEIDDEYLQKEILLARKRFGNMTNPEVSEEGDMLFGKLSVTADSVNMVPSGLFPGNGLEMMMVLNPDRIDESGFLPKMTGKHPGDMISGFALTELFTHDAKIRNLFGTPGTEEEGKRNGTDADLDTIKKLKFDFTVKNVNRMEAVEINQDFFDKVAGEGKVTSEEDFKAHYLRELSRHFKDDSESFFQSAIVEGLLESNPIPLPEDFLRRWLVRSGKEITADNIDDQYPGFAKGLRWSLLVNQLRKENPSILVTRDDVEKKIRDMLGERTGDTGTGERSEYTDTMVKLFMEDENYYKRIYEKLVDEMIFNFLSGKLGMEQKKIRASEYINLKS